MGFLSKLMKNPLMQAALPFALTAAMGPIGGALSKYKMFSGMSPLVANALKQSALGYGTAALSGSKRPWKGAMYAGLTSIPFSYMSAARAANAFNQDYAGKQGWKEVFEPTKTVSNIQAAGMPPMQATDFGKKFTGYEAFGPKTPKLSAWDILTNRYTDPSGASVRIPEGGLKIPPEKRLTLDPIDKTSRLTSLKGGEGAKGYTTILPEDTYMPKADIFTKQVPGKAMPMDEFGNVFMTEPETKTDWIPTAAAQAAALYGGRDTPEEEWEAAQKKRKKELAWMYGVDEDQIEGEMNNPWYTGGMFNAGGIASLDMSYGGDVSGPGGPKDDMIDAKLSDGEFVMTAKAVENFGGGDRYEGARKMYQMMNMLDPQSETMSEVV